MIDDFTICCLCYGDHPELAQRMLGSIRRVLPQQQWLRVGMNACSEATKAVVQQHHPNTVLDHPVNIHKYPLMRRLFRVAPIETKYVMWFDDDSYLKDTAFDSPSGKTWKQRVLEKMSTGVGQIGGIYTIAPRGNQLKWMRDQPWYRGPDQVVTKFKFVTGGWWVAPTKLILDLDYPWKELDHNGGDVMFSQAVQQQGKRISAFRDGVAINADANGKESRAKRRGFTQNPIGVDYEPQPGGIITV